MLMKIAGYGCLVMIIIVVLGGCSVHEATPQTADAVSQDWHAALLEDGSCGAKPDVAEATYVECLKQSAATARATAERDRSNAEALTKQLASLKASPDGFQPGPNAGLVPQTATAQAPQHAPPTYQQFLAIPAPPGAVCDSAKELTLTVTNYTPYLIEVNGGGKLAALGCDAQANQAYYDVVKSDGSAARVLAIPPAIDGRPATARFVFLPMNGGMGNFRNKSAVEVDFLRYVFQHSNDPMHPLPSGLYADMPVISKYYQVPRTDGNWIEIEL